MASADRVSAQAFSTPRLEGIALAASIDQLLARPPFPVFGDRTFPGDYSLCVHIVGESEELPPTNELRSALLHHELMRPDSECPPAYRVAPPDSVWTPIDTTRAESAETIHLYVSRPNLEAPNRAWVVVRMYLGHLPLLNACSVTQRGDQTDASCTWLDVIRP